MRRRTFRTSLAGLAGITALVIALVPGGYLGAAFAESLAYVRKFPGSPSSPQPLNEPDIDITVLGHDSYTIFPMQAGHGPDCSPPPATHLISKIDDVVFQCKNHIMTAIFSGYGSVYLTPNELMDFSQGEAVLKWDMSTQRTASRDWVDFTIQPFDQALQINFEDAHVPQEAVHLQMQGGCNCFEPSVWRNYVKQTLPADMFHGFDTFLEPSATRRDTFELHVSRDHIKFGMPDYNHWWVDTAISPPLTWNLGLIQLNQRSYNVEKSCATPDHPESELTNASGTVDNAYGATHCPPNTWHWDNIQIQPGVSFAMLRADRRVVDAQHAQAVTFPTPAPPNAHLHFVAGGVPLEYSLDGGASWQAAQIMGRPLNKVEHGEAYWQPVPQGTQNVMIRGYDHGTLKWAAQDIAIYGPPGSQSAGGSQPVPEGAVSAAPVTADESAPAPAADAAPTSAPDAPAPDAPVVVAPVAGAIAFDDLANPNRPLNGQYPSSVIDWGSNQWYLSGPFGAFNNQSIGFNGPGLNSGSFAFVTPRTLTSIDAYNGGSGASTITLSCAGQPDMQVSLASHQLATLQTGWSEPCGSVTVVSTNGWDTNFKNLVLGD
jgi:hypothetical protein